MKVLNLIKKEKKLYTEIAKIYGKNESSINDIGKKKKTFMLVLLFHLKLRNYDHSTWQALTDRKALNLFNKVF